MTDVDIVPREAVEEPVEDKQSLQTPEGQREDEDEDTDTDDGAVGEDEDIHGSLIITISPFDSSLRVLHSRIWKMLCREEEKNSER